MIMKSRPKKINNIISDSSQLKNLIQLSQQQQKILNIIKQLLPKSLAAHCISAQHIDQSVKVFTDSSVWASKLRFQSKNLCKELSAQGIATDKIDVRVSPQSETHSNTSKSRSSRLLSNQAAETILQTADSISDANLKLALQRLAKKVN